MEIWDKEENRVIGGGGEGERLSVLLVLASLQVNPTEAPTFKGGIAPGLERLCTAREGA